MPTSTSMPDWAVAQEKIASLSARSIDATSPKRAAYSALSRA